MCAWNAARYRLRARLFDSDFRGDRRHALGLIVLAWLFAGQFRSDAVTSHNPLRPLRLPLVSSRTSLGALYSIGEPREIGEQWGKRDVPADPIAMVVLKTARPRARALCLMRAMALTTVLSCLMWAGFIPPMRLCQGADFQCRRGFKYHLTQNLLLHSVRSFFRECGTDE